jgi:endo-beta-N-acetylglucosaminidase D
MSGKDSGAIEPTIKAIETMSQLRDWGSLKEGASVARVPLAQRSPVYGKSSWAGFDMGPWQYDTWFDEKSQGGHGQSDDGNRTAANVYNFSFWQYLDIFYYFGHQLLTIPPTVWTNAAHKNGVRSLGTLNLNWSESGEKFTEDDVVHFLSKQPTPPPQPKPIYLEEALTILKDIAGYYGFDGYLFNYEEYNFKVRSGMTDIMSSLKEAGLTVVWYDAPLSEGYSNRLTEDAYPFFEAAGYFQANYAWGPAYPGTNNYPEVSWEVLKQHLPENGALGARNRVCMMMDCYRQTQPYQGSFFTALALVDVPAGQPPGYYTALGSYAPDWVMYHGIDSNTQTLPSRETFHYNDRAFWAGTTKFFLDWPKPGENPIKPEECIAHYVKERSVITSTPFVTWFNGGEGDFYNIRGERKSTGPWNNLSDQSLLPTWRFNFSGGTSDTRIDDTAVDYDDAFTGGSSLRISFKGFKLTNPITVWLCKTEIILTATNILSLTVKGQGVDLAPILGDYELTNPQVGPVTNGWKQMTYTVPASLAGQTMSGIHIRVKQAPPEGEIRLGELTFLDRAQAVKKPWTRPFSSADVLDWSDSFEPSSHYRVYGVLNKEKYLIGIVYNSVYVTVSNVFNSDKKGFTSYIVQEVNAAGDFTPV